MLTRRAVLARAAVPVVGVLPIQWRHATAPPPPPRTRMILGGDAMLSRHVGELARSMSDSEWPWRDIAPVFQQADIAFVNLESPFSDGNGMEAGLVFKAAPEMILGLKLAGIDIVSTANNHARDQGAYGVEFTLDWLARNGIAAVGSARSEEETHAGTVIERNELRFGFLAYTYDQSNGNHKDIDARVALLDVARMRRDVAQLAGRADVVIVSMHAGREYVGEPNGQQTEFARSAIDAGARVVVGHHPHVVQPWERYRNGVIFYSLGNLVFDQYQRVETQRGALAEVVFEGAALAQARLHAVDIVRSVPRLNESRALPARPSGTAAAGAA